MRCLQPPQGRAADAARACSAPIPVLETERLVLRAPQMADCALWTQIWQGAEHSSKITDEDGWGWFSVYVAGWLLHGHGLWSVERKDTGALIGFVLLGLEWGDVAPELGWAFAPGARGKGYATEAANAARAHAIELLGEGAAVSHIAEGNAASPRVAERIGATRIANYDETTRVYRHGASQKDLTQ